MRTSLKRSRPDSPETIQQLVEEFSTLYIERANDFKKKSSKDTPSSSKKAIYSDRISHSARKSMLLDRYIPRRLNNTGSLWNELDRAVSWPELPNEQYLIHNLSGMDRATFVSKKIMAIRPSAYQLPPSVPPVCGMNKSVASLSLKKKQPVECFTLSRILDVPGIPDDYYRNLLAWSDVNRYFVPVETGMNGEFQIISALAEFPHNSQIIHFPSVAPMKPYALAAFGMNQVISGWDDGSLRIYRVDQPDRTERTLSNLNAGSIQAIVPLDQQTCMLGTNLSELIHIDFRRARGVAQVVNANAPYAGADYAKITALAYDSGYYLASGSNNNLVKIWDTRNISAPVQINTTHTSGIKALSFQPGSGKYLLSGGGALDRRLCLWNIHAGQSECVVDTGAQITGVVWHNPDYFVTSHGHNGSGIKMWDIKRDKISKKSELNIEDPENRVLCLAGSKTSPYIAGTMSHQSIRFFKCEPNPVTAKSRATERPSMFSLRAMDQSMR